LAGGTPIVKRPFSVRCNMSEFTVAVAQRASMKAFAAGKTGEDNNETAIMIITLIIFLIAASIFKIFPFAVINNYFQL
jgi:hypothetical protein